MLNENRKREKKFPNWLDNYRISKVEADLNFKVDFGLNGAIGTVATEWDLILFGK